ncbi:MAG TPA: hypothetical protein VHK06_04475, partial [Candidatus Limnocylindria bacterium]|nr:hypothetical protein [Candidatus Limnocylindria bacterium]
GVLAGVSLLHGPTDPDFYWHVTVGREIVESGALPTHDSYSFTRAGAPWIAEQWLGEVLIAAVVALGIAPALIVFGSISALGLAMLAMALRSRGVRTAAIIAALMPAVWLIGLYVTLRPQVVSWSLLAAVVALLVWLRPEARAASLAIPIVFAIWVNIHGLYLVGLAVAVTYLAFTVLRATPMYGARRWIAGVGVATAIACLLSPYGPAVVAYLFSFADVGDWGMRNLLEWQSPDFHDPALLPLLALIVAVVLLGRRHTDGWIAVCAYFGVVLALYAVRNAPVAGILAVPLLAMELDARIPNRPSMLSQARPRAWLDCAAGLTIGVAALGIGLATARPAEAVATRFPVDAARVLRATDRDARVLAHYGWGGYVIHELHASGARVFVDGRNHLYGDALLEEYGAIIGAAPGWSELVHRYGVEALLIRTDQPLARGPAVEAGWCEAYRDDMEVLLLPACPAG